MIEDACQEERGKKCEGVKETKGGKEGELPWELFLKPLHQLSFASWIQIVALLINQKVT